MFIFDIIKIAKLLETEGFKIDPTWRGTLHENMISNMDNIENTIKINNYIKETLRTIEYETLIHLANFLIAVYPDFEENTSNFNECLENLCFRLFGFKYEEIRSPTDLGKAENILIVSRKFMDLFEFIIVLLRYKNENPLNPSNDQIFKKTCISTSHSKFATTLMSKSNSKFFSILGDNEYKQILSASLNNPEKDKHTINKEKFMLNLYQSLGRYFNSNIEGIYQNKVYIDKGHQKSIGQNNKEIEEFFSLFQTSLEKFTKEHNSDKISENNGDVLIYNNTEAGLSAERSENKLFLPEVQSSIIVNNQKSENLAISSLPKQNNNNINNVSEKKESISTSYNEKIEEKNKPKNNKINIKKKDSFKEDFINEDSISDNNINDLDLSNSRKKNYDNFATDEEDINIFVNAKMIKNTDYNLTNDANKFSRPTSRMRKGKGDIESGKKKKKSIESQVRNYEDDDV